MLLNPKNYSDLFNTTTENFNPHGVVRITEDLVRYYAPYHDNPDPKKNCRTCLIELLNENDRPDCFKLCKMTMRGTETQNKNKNQYYTCETVLSTPNNPHPITIRRAQMFWLYDNEVQIIIRGTRKNRIVIHHRDGNPYNDSKGNLSMVTKHSYRHGCITRLNSIMKMAIEAKQILGQKSPRILTEMIQKIIEVITRVEDIIASDSPDVWRIIYINHLLLDNKISFQECQQMMIKHKVLKG